MRTHGHCSQWTPRSSSRNQTHSTTGGTVWRKQVRGVLVTKAPAHQPTVTLGLRWCWMLGRCSYNAHDAGRAALISHGPNRFGRQSLEHWAATGLQGPASLFGCWAGTQLHATSNEENSAGMDDVPPVLYVFKHVAAGPGNATMHPFMNFTLWQDEAPPGARLSVMQYMRQYVCVAHMCTSCGCTSHKHFMSACSCSVHYFRCAGLQPTPMPRPATHQPRLVLLNRRYQAGRGLLRLDEVAWRVRQALDIDVRIEFLEGLSFQGRQSLVACTTRNSSLSCIQQIRQRSSTRATYCSCPTAQQPSTCTFCRPLPPWWMSIPTLISGATRRP